jgi:hypothetical protein
LGGFISILGITSYFQIQTTVVSVADGVARQEAQKAFSDDAESLLKDARRTVTRIRVDSYLLQLAQNKNKVFAPPLKVSQDDIVRMLDLLKDPASSESDFSDACTVLSNVRGDPQSLGIDLQGALSALAAADDKDVAWLKSNPRKRAMIFQNFSDASFVHSAHAILDDPDQDPVLADATIVYLSRTNDGRASIYLEKIAQQKDKDTYDAAVMGLARIQPHSDTVVSAMKDYLGGGDLAHYKKAVNLISALLSVPAGTPFGSDADRAYRIDAAAEALGRIIQKGVRFQAIHILDLSSSTFGMTMPIRTPTISRQFAEFGLDSTLFKNADFTGLLLRKAAKDAKALTVVMEALCFSPTGQCSTAVDVILPNKGGSIALSDGKQVDGKSARGKINLEVQPGGKLTASWTDPAGGAQSGEVSKFAGSDLMSFEFNSKLDGT